MAIREIVKVGDPVLREKSRPVEVFDARLRQLLDDMFDTMFKADGVGLAAPQIGVLRRMCVVSVDGGKTKYELVNPEILKTSGSRIAPEGCLSCPGRRGTVARPKKVTVRAQDRTGKTNEYHVSGLTAVAFCHEIDHLDGILFIDKIIEEEDEA